MKAKCDDDDDKNRVQTKVYKTYCIDLQSSFGLHQSAIIHVLVVEDWTNKKKKKKLVYKIKIVQKIKKKFKNFVVGLERC